MVKFNQLIPMNAEHVLASVEKTHCLAVVEEVIQPNSVGMALSYDLADRGIQLDHLILLSSGVDFVPQGTVKELHQLLGIDAPSIAKTVKEALG